MASPRWVLYGANGYTGELVARLAAERGASPLLAGRSARVADLGRELGLEHRVVDLADAAGLEALLVDAQAVLNCAGPFSATAEPMLEACLATSTHYADITGEIASFEAAYARHDRGVAAGVSLVPGVGFDVVPTDHLLATLHAQMPEAVAADVALFSRGGFSGGTLRTVVEGLRGGGVVRRNGRLVGGNPAQRRRVTIGRRSYGVVSAPLGDVASGYRATHIPDITTFSAMPMAGVVAGTQPLVERLLRNDMAHALALRALRGVSGPSAEARESAASDVWVELRDTAGSALAGALRVPSTYTFTARSALHAVERIAAEGATPGAWAPSQALGADFLRTIPGVEVRDLEAGGASTTGG